MSQGESTTPPQAFTWKPTEQEEAHCPYLFEELEVLFFKETPQKVTYYVKWRGQDVWSRHIEGPCHYDKDNEEITLADWNFCYPGYKHLTLQDPTPEYFGQTSLNKHRQKCLTGKFGTKIVLWSPSKNAFLYTNNLSVTFPPDRTPSSRPPSSTSAKRKFYLKLTWNHLIGSKWVKSWSSQPSCNQDKDLPWFWLENDLNLTWKVEF